jgi:two-component system sensor histidine kinase/response regulator
MYFGSTEGFTAFYPDQIALSGYEPFVVLTELRLANEPVTVKPGGTLDHAIWDLNRLTLRHDDDIVSFAFAALDYAAPQKLQYQYRLQGLERDWVTVDSEHRFATYTHLPAGEYVFRVQGTNKSGVWSRHEAALALTVLPAWWETGWFRAGVAILLIGAVTAGVRWRMHDLEQRSRALEVEVAARTKRLQESEKRFREMTELLPNAVVELDAGYQITYVNRSGLSLFGYSEADIDKGLNAMDLLKPEARERAVQRIGQYIAGKDLPPTEYQIQTKDGTEMPVLLKAAPIQQDGEIRGFRASLTDISELTAAQDELAAALERARRLQDKAEAANQAKSTFLANMSHELRTPLNAILGYSQLMARDADVTSVQRENLAVVIRSGEHLLGLINDILALSKIEAGCKTFQAGAFDLHRLVQSLQEMFQLRADDKRLTLQVEITADVPRYIVTDEGKLRQVLMNLLSNAVKFTDEGGVTVRVGGRPYQADEASRISRFHPLSPDFLLRIEVEDSGVGIAPDELDALFDPFVQTFSGRQSQEGTGLGLPISQQFVDLMGGELSVKSVISRGAIFGVHLPVVQTDADSAAVEVRPRRRVTGIEPGQTAPDGGLFRLLVVEDRATNRNLLLKLLRPFGFEMRSASHGVEGIELWETWEPHLVWMDMRMPVMDGYTATREIKARAAVEGRATVVVALTASSFEEDREAILAAGCDDSIRKPYRERDVFDVLHRHLGIHFIYEDDPPALAERDESAGCTSRDTLQTALTEMSAAWADALYEAAAALDADRMLALIEALRPQAPDVADILTQWVHDYEYDKIIALLEPEH